MGAKANERRPIVKSGSWTIKLGIAVKVDRRVARWGPDEEKRQE